MHPVLRWSVRILGGLLALLVVALAAVYGASEVRFRKRFDVSATPLAVQPSEALVEQGHRLTITRGCTDCHSEDLGGKMFIDAAPVARLWAANLTGGEGGAARLSDTELEHAIRHGVRSDGTPLLFMPAHEFAVLTDEDVAALISYLRSLSPIERRAQKQSVGPVGRALYLAGQMPLVPAELVDHQAGHQPMLAVSATAEYGKYLAATCTGCHGTGLSGGKIPGGPPGTPTPLNLTPERETGLGAWTEADFFRALRTGVRPDGKVLNEFMPWKATAQLNDDEIRALWLYLQTVPAKPFGQR